MGSNNRDKNLIYSYLALRKAVGWMGILLPSCFVFWGETVALGAFGISWLTKAVRRYEGLIIMKGKRI
jgi:hypothetical protein